MAHQASFIGSLVPEAEIGEDLVAFPPSIDDDYRGSMMGQVHHTIVYADRPEVREVVRFLTSPEFGVVHVHEMPGELVPHRRFDPSSYPDWRRELAPALAAAQAADLFRDDGSDLMPPSVGSEPIWDGVLDYLDGGPDSLDGVLASLDGVLASLDAAWER